MNKKATVIVTLSVIGLIIGIITMLGLRAMLAPEDRPAYIGEQQLAILKTDTQLGTEQFFVQEAAPFAVSAALFSLGQHGGFSQASASPCGQDGKIPTWAKMKANKYCIPEPEKALEGFLTTELQAYLRPLLEIPTDYAIVAETVRPGILRVVGKARTLRTAAVTMREKRAPVAHVGMNLSFAAEVEHDFDAYEALAAEVKTMVEGIRSCVQSKKLPVCVGEWVDEINKGPFLADKRITLHFDDCHYSADVEREKLGSHQGGLYRFCAIANNGRTFMALDAEKGTVEKRLMEYQFGVDFE